MPGKPLRFAKKIADIFEPGFVPFHMRLMPQSKLGACLGGSFIVAEQNHVYIRVHERPALERVPLNHPLCPLNGLAVVEKVIISPTDFRPFAIRKNSFWRPIPPRHPV